ncbi:hypothetical protein L9F63_021549, partial [Diploptera punctata]
IHDRLVVTRANIRIWIHDRDLGRLQQMLWEGHGGKLRVETSNNPRVKRFLDAVPYIMGTIKDVHGSVVNNDEETFQKRTADPVPNQIFISKDQNGLNPLHKAAGLGRADMVEDIISRNSNAVTATDNEGRTPLHYAVLAKDGGIIYNKLIDAGADENALDNKGKPPSYYRSKPAELDPKNLQVIPDAPRTATIFPPAWDWRLLNNMTYDFGPIPVDSDVKYDDEKGPTKSKKQKGMGNMAAAAAGAAVAIPAAAAAGAATIGVVKQRTRSPSPVQVNKVESPPEDEEEDEGVGEEGEQEEEREDLMAHEERALALEAENAAEGETEEGGTEEDDSGQGRDEGEESEEGKMEDAEEKELEGGIVAVIGGEEGTVDRWEREEDEVGGGQEAEEDEVGGGEETEGDEVGRGDEVGGEEAEGDEAMGEEVKEINDDGMDGMGETMPDILVVPQEPDEEVQRLVEQGNMEQLANLVLNGEGHRLIGQTSDDPELQGFLNNVPAYMAKIRAVHEAAQEGRLRDLQAALDRRKFAIARDGSNSMGTTPLHVATLFGHTAIVRYLAGRFPETLQTRDKNDRTPLHYAATMMDNGHYYNLLLNLGADPSLKDNLDNTAEYYLMNSGILTHQDLLEEYGASAQVAEDMLQDQVPNDTVSARREIDDPEILDTLERCFELVREETSTNGQISSGFLLKRYLRRLVFENLRLRLTRMDHNLLDVIWPGAKEVPEENDADLDEELEEVILRNGGVIAPDYESYAVFDELLIPLIKDLHGLLVNYDLHPQPKSMFFLPDEDDDENEEEEIRQKKGRVDKINIDPSHIAVNNVRIECCRNVADYQLPSGLTYAQLESLERDLVSALDTCNGVERIEEDYEDENKSYYSMAEILEETSMIREKLESSNLLVTLSDQHENEDSLLHGQHWPHGRGVYLMKGGHIAIWINVQEHIRVLSIPQDDDDPGRLDEAYNKLAHLMMDLETMFEFKRDPLLGYLTARPSMLGNTLHIYVTAHLPKLGQDENALNRLCSARSINISKLSEGENNFLLWNQQSLGITEHQTLMDFSTAISNVIQLEGNA